jgi:hypothetical protein
MSDQRDWSGHRRRSDDYDGPTDPYDRASSGYGGPREEYEPAEPYDRPRDAYDGPMAQFPSPESPS